MPKDQNELPEIVGSKDLRETFKNNGRVRGSFFINNVEFHQFEATSIPGLIAAINARSAEAFVTATIDDSYHLVLEATSPSDIKIRAGAAYQEAPPAGNDTAAAVKAAVRELMMEERRRRGDEVNENTILDDLGLEATDEGDAPHANSPEMVPAGMSAEDRRRARHERAVAAGAIRGLPADIANQEWHGSRAVPQGSMGGRDMADRRFNPIGTDRLVADAAQANPGQDANNPQFQRAPSSNSDRQPTVHEGVGRGPGS